MNKFMLAILIGLTTILTGCFATAPETIVKTEYVVIKPAADQIRACDINELPPNKDEYVAADMQRREQMLADYTSRLQKEFAKCNLRWPALQQWYLDQQNNYSKKE